MEQLNPTFDLESFRVDPSVSAQVEKEPEPTPEPEGDSPEEPVETETAPPEGAFKTVEGIKKHLTGAVMLNLIDIVISRLFPFVMNRFGYVTTYKDFKLDAEEKKTLSPLFDSIAKEWIQKLKPEHVFYLMFGAIYLSKVLVITEQQTPVSSSKTPADEIRKPAGGGRGRPKGVKNKIKQDE